jgi:hypothetical protein
VYTTFLIFEHMFSKLLLHGFQFLLLAFPKIPAKLLGELPNPMFFGAKPSYKSFPQHFPGSKSSAGPRKRQAAITAEICEISAAANAIEAADKKGAAGPGLGVMDNENSVAEDFMKELDSGDVPDTWNAILLGNGRKLDENHEIRRSLFFGAI